MTKAKVVKRPRRSTGERGSGRQMKMVGFSFHPSTLERLDKALAPYAITRSEFVETLLRRKLDEMESEVAENPDSYAARRIREAFPPSAKDGAAS